MTSKNHKPGRPTGNHSVCIANDDGDVIRTSREGAAEWVENGWHYVPKSVYKAANRGR